MEKECEFIEKKFLIIIGLFLTVFNCNKMMSMIYKQNIKWTLRRASNLHNVQDYSNYNALH